MEELDYSLQSVHFALTGLQWVPWSIDDAVASFLLKIALQSVTSEMMEDVALVLPVCAARDLANDRRMNILEYEYELYSRIIAAGKRLSSLPLIIYMCLWTISATFARTLQYVRELTRIRTYSYLLTMSTGMVLVIALLLTYGMVPGTLPR